MRVARRWLIFLVVLAAIIPICIAFVDRPVSTFAHDVFLPQRKFFDALTHLVDPFHVLASLVLLWTLVQIVRGVRLSAFEDVVLRAAIALAAAVMVKDQLKWAFGRTWPETWVQNNPSFIGNGTFGFFPFHGGQGWYSFPSGHTTIICAVMGVFWMRWPRLRPLWILVAMIVVVGLLGADYHFVSDILAGAALGGAIGLVAADFGLRAPS